MDTSMITRIAPIKRAVRHLSKGTAQPTGRRVAATRSFLAPGVMPGKYDELPAEETPQDGANRGQVMVMFAIFAMVMLGMMGLATDVGYAMAAKRSVQGAADAGALAGARMIARYTTAAPTAAQGEVLSVVQKNTLGTMTPSVLSCEYIGPGWNVVGTCNQNVPSSAVGARVKTRGTYNTWFIRILPGAPKTVTVGGYAKARVQNASKTVSDAPFLICGDNAWDVTSNPLAIGQAIGSTFKLLSATSPMTINSAAVGKTFRINDASLPLKTGTNCGAPSKQFTGLADQTANAGKSSGSWFAYKTSGTPGAIKTKIDGAGGCATGAVSPYNCVMILPIAKTGASGTDNKLYVVGFAAFQVSQVNPTTYNAKLLDDYIITGSGGSTWCRDCGGTVVIRLIW